MFEFANRLMFVSLDMNVASASSAFAASSALSRISSDSCSDLIVLCASVVRAFHHRGTEHTELHDISTLRNRATGAPCATRIVCIGSPLPQFGRPQICQESRSAMASHERQKSGVLP